MRATTKEATLTFKHLYGTAANMIEKNFLKMISSRSKPQRSNRFRRIRDSNNNGIVLGTLVLLAVTLVIVSIFVSVFTSRPNIQHTQYYQEPEEEQLIVMVDITFDITNECGLNADAVMNGEKNTLKAGLTNALYEISALSLHDEQAKIKVSSVSIGRILDIESGCDVGKNCLLFVSTISLALHEGTNGDEAKNKVSNYVIESFRDGSFAAVVPDHAQNCLKK